MSRRISLIHIRVVCGVLMIFMGCQESRGESAGLTRPSAADTTREQTGPHFERANDALLDDLPDHAIELCERGVERGEVACHRLLGIAHKQKGEHEAACRHFALAITHDDPHHVTIERYQKHLHCQGRD